jgi:CheY-like chemotaxis protein
MSDTVPNRRILIVDDNRAIHDDFKKILCPQSVVNRALSELEDALFGDSLGEPDSGEQFILTSAFQGQEALKLVEGAKAENQPFAMAFVDTRMPPGWDGVETIEHIWKVTPSLQVVICSAYSDYSWEDISARLGRSDQLLIMMKPFGTIELRQLALDVTARWTPDA